MPIGIPVLGVVKKEMAFDAKSSAVIRPVGKARSTAVRWPWGDTPLRLHSSALLWGAVFGGSAPARGNALFSGRGSCTPQARGELPYVDRSPHRKPLIGPSSCE